MNRCILAAALCFLCSVTNSYSADTSKYGRIVQGISCTIPDIVYLWHRGEEATITVFIENTYSIPYTSKVYPVFYIVEGGYTASVNISDPLQAIRMDDGVQLVLGGKEIKRYDIDLSKVQWGYDWFGSSPAGDMHAVIPKGAYSLHFKIYSVEEISAGRMQFVREQNEKLPQGQSIEPIPLVDGSISNQVNVRVE